MRKSYKYIGAIVLLLAIIIVGLPKVVSISIQREQSEEQSNLPAQFPITVDPKNKVITENNTVNKYLEGTSSPLMASVGNLIEPIWNILKTVGIKIGTANWYHNAASLASLNGQFVEIYPGMRKEQVVNAFAKTLDWSESDKQQFLNGNTNSDFYFSEGAFYPTTYFIDPTMTPEFVRSIVDKKFNENVLKRYGTSTAELVPVKQALILASIIQRETIGNVDVRLISGILWNRLFINMNLQVDATLQYAKANKNKTEWWPKVAPKDKYIKSPFNTYMNNGLPPAPIANPSVGAILATLNPIKTSCLYYFNDKDGEFHCSETYAEHVKQIRKYYK